MVFPYVENVRPYAPHSIQVRTIPLISLNTLPVHPNTNNVVVASWPFLPTHQSSHIDAFFAQELPEISKPVD